MTPKPAPTSNPAPRHRIAARPPARSTLGQELPSPRSGLLAVPWLRVVLDEGHTIKNPDARQTKVRS